MDEATESAWAAFEAENYDLAAQIWQGLIGKAAQADVDALRSQYGYTLVGQKKFDEARQLYQELFDSTQDHKYLHQLGMVAREAGALEEALALFKEESKQLEADNLLGQAANCYEQGLLNHLLQRAETALSLASQCLTLSLQTQDSIMHGCAYRLLGDLYQTVSAEKALTYYRQSQEAFTHAGDLIGAKEIEGRIAQLT